MANNDSTLAPGARSGDVTLTGVASAVQQRTEWINEGSRSIWTFRVEGTDQNGLRLGPVQVEMRGISFEGNLTNGDAVRVTGRWRRGSIRADQVQNLTTGALVRAKNYTGLKVAMIAVFLMVAGAIAFFAIGASRESDERREEIQRQQQELQGDVSEDFCKTAEEAGVVPPQCEDR